ncbi:MAG: 3'(2'),5'-bisphosphate nucleotidase CysQ, partial [Syntrophobacteraceae bacterium]|nr:3'(2'),5'-bisphosphate nucleotidase CysQ [Syntrophobacteraceae bacterium]
MDLDYLGRLAKDAGKAILEVYRTDFAVENKDDSSPLTLADTRSHRIIADGLRSKYPDIPVLSEEGKEIAYAVRKDWSTFWLVDPLDGTKEFVKRNDEFTINIALVEGVSPVLGIIYLPVFDKLYVGDVTQGCWEMAEAQTRRLQVRQPEKTDPVRVVKSRSHPSPNLQTLLDHLPGHEVLTRGSALKFCAVARGDADFYPRFGPTWEWDTAAGQAIVTAAGGVLVDPWGRPFTYNKESLLNGPFLVACSQRWLSETGLLEVAAGLVQTEK